MRKLLSLFLLIGLCAAQQTPSAPEAPATPSAAKPADRIVVPAGTAIPIMLNGAPHSDQVKENDVIEAVVLQDVAVDGRVVIAKGARATALVAHSRASGRGHDGRLALKMRDVVAVDGSVLPIRFARVPRKGTKGETTTDLIVFSPVMLLYSPYALPALAVYAPIALFQKGKPQQLPLGDRYEVYVAEQRELSLR